MDFNTLLLKIYLWLLMATTISEKNRVNGNISNLQKEINFEFIHSGNSK